MILCLCKIATDRDVADAIECGARTVTEVGQMCGAGTGCGACKESIYEMLETRADKPACFDCPARTLPVTSEAA